MSNYKNILLALALEPESDSKVLAKAQELVAAFGSKIWVVHAVEYLSSYGAAYGVAAGIDVDTVLKTEAEQLMTKIVADLGIPANQAAVLDGPAKQMILAEADRSHANLIIVGSHGRHGVQLLLGSTANAIMHGAKCDVLAVRV